MFSLIIAESAIFMIFVVAYVYYMGKSTYGPTAAAGAGAADLQHHLSAFEQRHHHAGGARAW